MNLTLFGLLAAKYNQGSNEAGMVTLQLGDITSTGAGRNMIPQASSLILYLFYKEEPDKINK